jgi:hypothetical protein
MRRINPSTIIATLALFVSLSGAAVAATMIGTNQIKDGAVTKAKIASNAVTSAKVKDGSLTSADIAPNTFLGATATANDSSELGGKPANAFVQGTGNMVANRIQINAGQTRILMSLGFGYVQGNCKAGGVPQLEYVSESPSVNLVDWLTNYGSPSGTAEIHTANGVSQGGTYPQLNSSVTPQSVTWQAAYDDGSTVHTATAWTSGQDIGTTSCIFIGQGLTTQ